MVYFRFYNRTKQIMSARPDAKRNFDTSYTEEQKKELLKIIIEWNHWEQSDVIFIYPINKYPISFVYHNGILVEELEKCEHKFENFCWKDGTFECVDCGKIRLGETKNNDEEVELYPLK